MPLASIIESRGKYARYVKGISSTAGTGFLLGFTLHELH